MIADRETAPHEDASPCGAGGFGATLRETRQAQGLDIPAIANRLKIRSVYLRALEEEDIAALPARPFAIGFLRSYARLLKLDPDPLVATLKRMLDGPDAANPPARESAFAKAPESVPAGAAAARSRSGKERSTARLLTPLLFVAAALGLGFALPVGAPSVEGQTRVAVTTTEQASRAARSSEEAADKAAALPTREKDRAASGRTAARSAGPTAAKAARKTPRSEERHPAAAVAFRARAGAWVLVKDERGRPLWSGVLAQGQFWAPPEGAVRMTTTHPGNLILLVDGVEKGALGVAAQPLLDVPLAKPALLAFLAEQARQSRLVRAAR